LIGRRVGVNKIILVTETFTEKQSPYLQIIVTKLLVLLYILVTGITLKDTSVVILRRLVILEPPRVAVVRKIKKIKIRK
jgi:hypothetical protein